MIVKPSKELYRWDIDVEVEITLEDGESIDEVDFKDPYGVNALVVPMKYTDDGNVIVNIPNILLQHVFDIYMYVVKDDQTISEYPFKVKPRQKPSDYIYTETEVLTYKKLEDRITKLEEAGSDIPEEAVASAVESYLTENPIKVDEKVTLPTNEDGSVNNGEAGQFAVSDGKGGITWLTVVDGNEVAY